MALLATAANAMLDALLGAAHDTDVPGTLYLALSTTDPNASLTEPSVGGYARASVANDGTMWPAASAGSKSNGVAVLLPEATADYPQVGWFALCDALTAGNIVVSGALTAPVTVTTGLSPRFAAGTLIVTVG
jgi:hypothetical protein